VERGKRRFILSRSRRAQRGGAEINFVPPPALKIRLQFNAATVFVEEKPISFPGSQIPDGRSVSMISTHSS
jgi:hypothetical protein